MKAIKNHVMTLITKAQYTKLRNAAIKAAKHDGVNMLPIVKLYMEHLTWLVTEIDGNGMLYGYGDLSQGCVEWGSLCHESQLPTLRGRIAYLERDRWFKPDPKVNYLELKTLAGI